MQALLDTPGHLVRRVQQISAALFAEECAAFDLTAVQYAALVAIGSYPDVDATRLSQLVAFDRSTLGDVLERMEAKGWVARGPSQSDKRVKRIRLTRRGADLLRHASPAVGRVQQRLLAPLPPADQAVLIRLLAQIAQTHNDVTAAPLRDAPAQGRTAA